MFIQAFPSGPFDTNAYIVVCEETDEAIIIDPAPESSSSLTEFITEKKLKPVAIVLTHSHWDHIGDVAAVKALYPVPVMIHPEDAPNLRKPGSDGLPCWLTITGLEPDRLINDGDKITVGSHTFEVIDTPGHTPGGVCLYCPKEKVLISGDTLFQGSIGNISFATARPEKMWVSLDRLAKLPADTRVYPGHGPKTTIGAEHWLPQAKKYFS